MKLITGLEYLSKIRRKASWSPWDARATRSAELFIRDAANAPGCPSRLNSWASRFIMFRCVSEPEQTKVSVFCSCNQDFRPQSAIPKPALLALAVDKDSSRRVIWRAGPYRGVRHDNARLVTISME